MSSFIIKLIAIISMLIDHTNDAFIGHFTSLNLIGRIAFPLFCFQIVIGYLHTRNIGKYLFRLFLFALVSQVPYMIFMHNYANSYFYLNVYFTLALGLICLYIIDNSKINSVCKILCIIALMLLSEFTNMDYGIWGLLTIICIYIFYPFKNKLKSNSNSLNKSTVSLYLFISFLLCFFKYLAQIVMDFGGIMKISINIAYLLPYALLTVFTFIPFILSLFYNGKKGASLKYFFYIFYPVHLAILDLLVYFLR